MPRETLIGFDPKIAALLDRKTILPINYDPYAELERVHSEPHRETDEDTEVMNHPLARMSRLYKNDPAVMDKMAHHATVRRQIRSDDGDLLKMYMDDISKYPLLNKDQEVALADVMSQGIAAYETLCMSEDLDHDKLIDLIELVKDGVFAYQAFIASNLRLAFNFARIHYENKPVGDMSLLDLNQEALIGLQRAVQKFDASMDFKFSTYAVRWIKQTLDRGSGDKSRTIRIPAHIHQAYIKVTRIEHDLVKSMGREPTLEEVAAEAELSPERVEELKRVGSEHLTSLNKHVGEEGDSELGETLPTSDNTAETVVNKLSGDDILLVLEDPHLLTDQERLILSLRNGYHIPSLGDFKVGYNGNSTTYNDLFLECQEQDKPFTLEQLGQYFGVTRERIRQIETRAIAKLHIAVRPTKKSFVSIG